MGTNLSQVFIANGGTLEAPGSDGADAFLDVAKAEVGIWNTTKYGSNSDQWINSKLYAKAVAEADTAGAVAGTPIANPLWLFSQIQFVQGTGTSVNPIASPIINTSSINRVGFEPYTASVGHIQTLTVDPVANKLHTVKFIFRTTPVDQLNFNDANGTGYNDLSGANKDFPAGVFNATNHKAISIEVNSGADLAAFAAAIKAAVEKHSLLNNLVVAGTSATPGDLYTARHAGVIFDMILWNTDDDVKSTTVASVTAAVIGVGNPWQVLGEEIRCRSRYGNFNRMYLPQNMPTYTTAGHKYHKVTVEYEHNWPTSTGIAPAGTLNQIVMYFGGSSTVAGANTTIDAAFNLANVTAAQKFVW